MNILENLKDLEAKGLELWLEGDRLRYRGSRHILTPLILNELKQNKEEIINLLRKTDNGPNLFPLSHNQRSLWFLHQLAPESAAYNVGFTARIRSKIDIPALKRAFEQILSRHATLRTTYPKRGHEPVQEIHQKKPLCFEHIDASNWEWGELTKKVSKAYQRPFDLEVGPLLRANLFTRSEVDHILLLTIHHISCDAWSLWLLLDELRLLYPEQQKKTVTKLPSPELSYKDYVRWQNQMLTGPEGEKLWAYWRNQLDGELPVLNLPTDKPRPSVQTYNGGSHPFKLTTELTERLRRLSQTEGTTLYMTLVAAFQVLLHRYTGQEEIILGSPISGRSQVDFSDIVGDFMSPIVLRGSLSGNNSFKSFLNQARQTVLGTLAHQDFPFSLLVERLRLDRDSSRSPIFQVMFNFQKPQQFQEVIELWVAGETGEQVEWGGLSLEPFAMPQQEGQLDLTLEMIEGRASLFGVIKYNSDLFESATINRMEGHFQTLLEGIAAHPEQSISELPLLTDQEQHQLLVTWNENQAEYPKEKSIHELFEDQVRRTPAAVAAVFEGRQLTYRQPDTQAETLVCQLKKHLVGGNKLVGLCVERSLDMLVGLLGILKSGSAYLPLDPDHPKKRIEFILKDAGIEVLVTQPNVLSKLSYNTSFTQIDDLADGEKSAEGFNLRIVRLDKSNIDHENVLVHGSNDEIGPDNLAYVIYTSGSTGTPKGVQIPHRAVVNFLISMSKEPGMTDQDIILAVTTLSFDIAGLELLLPIIVGGRVIIAKREDVIDGWRLATLLKDSGCYHYAGDAGNLANTNRVGVAR